LAFRSGAAKALHIIPDEDVDDIDIAVAKLICQEVDCISIDKNNYKSHLDYNDTSELVSNTLLNLLSSLSPAIVMLIGNIITSVLKNHPNQLQISLAVLLWDSKELVKAMNDFGVTCSYGELLHFKKSSAVAAATSSEFNSHFQS